MKNILNRFLLLTFALVPVLCLTDTAKNSLLAAVATFLSLALAVIARYLSPRFIPQNVKNIVILFFIAFGISVTEIVLKPIAGSNTFLPLCAVPAVLLLSQLNAKENIRTLSVRTAISGGLFAVLLLIIGVLREFLGLGSVFSLQIIGEKLKPAAIFSLPAGAIFIISLLIAVLQHFAKEDGENA